MKLSGAGELSLLDSLRRRFKDRAEGLILGIGDDAAVIRHRGDLLLTTDMMVEGVHFDLSWTTAYQLGYKLVAVNVSDIYAMGGSPRFLLLNFSSPGSCTTSFFNDLFDGVKAALKEYGAVLIGGDISASDRIMLSATVVGSATKVVRRSGARAGDRIYVTGPLGDSACGLDLLRKISRPVDLNRRSYKGMPLKWNMIRPLAARHLMPKVRNSSRYAVRANAMMDISDGLLIDLSRLCRESRVGATVYEEQLPISDELKAAADHLGKDPLSYALSGGEDYEVLFTAPPDAEVDACCIGKITGRGMFMIKKDNRRIKISAKGYQHFSLQR